MRALFNSVNSYNTFVSNSFTLLMVFKSRTEVFGVHKLVCNNTKIYWCVNFHGILQELT